MGDERLSLTAREKISDPNNELLLSTASLWEISIKVSLGKLEFNLPFSQLIPEQLDLNGIQSLAIQLRHLSALTELPWHHRDPFDRLIIAQALIEDLPLMTRDRHVEHYVGLKLIW